MVSTTASGAVGPRLVVAGVAGSGKSTVARSVADRLGWAMLEADSLHASAHIAQMGHGIPLTDAQRSPWLARVAEAMNQSRGGLVVACSALRRDYREFLRKVGEVCFCLLEISPEVARSRMANRPGHFAPTSLLPSQFATLEPLAADEHGFVVDADQDLATVVEQVIGGLGAPEGDHDLRADR